LRFVPAATISGRFVAAMASGMQFALTALARQTRMGVPRSRCMDDFQLLIALLLYVLVIGLAVAWLYGPKALLAEKVRLERSRRQAAAAAPQHPWRRTRLFPGSSSH
jgi:hypothetical protein